MKKKKIAVSVYWGTQSGGSSQYTDTALEALAQLDPARYEIRVWAVFPEWLPVLKQKGLHSVVPASLALYNWLERLGRLVRLPAPLPRGQNHSRRLTLNRRDMEAWRPDMFLYLDQSTEIAPLPTKQVACIHDLMNRYETQFPEVGMPEVFAHREKIQRSIVENCDGILVDSEVGKKHVMECYGAASHKIFHLPFSVHSSLSNITPRKVNVLEPLIGNYLFYPAQFFLHKNHFGLLEAINKLKNKGLIIHCVFVGNTEQDGFPLFYYLSRKLRLEQQIHVLGYVNDAAMKWLYMNARCMVMPTFFGPTNLPPLEALHFGCPVAVSGNYGMPEQLEDAALYFDPNNISEIAEIIERLWCCEETRARLKNNALQVKRRTSSAEFMQKLKAIIDEILW